MTAKKQKDIQEAYRQRVKAAGEKRRYERLVSEEEREILDTTLYVLRSHIFDAQELYNLLLQKD